MGKWTLTVSGEAIISLPYFLFPSADRQTNIEMKVAGDFKKIASISPFDRFSHSAGIVKVQNRSSIYKMFACYNAAFTNTGTCQIFCTTTGHTGNDRYYSSTNIEAIRFISVNIINRIKEI